MAAAVAALPALGVGSTATAAELSSGPTPLAYLGTATCPSADDASGRTTATGAAAVARAVTHAKDSEAAPFFASLALIGALDQPSAAIVLCDPAAASARAPLGPLSGPSAGSAKSTDVSGPGLRARVGATGSTSGSLSVGDHLALPPTSQRATLDLAVRAANGAVTPLRLGPFTAPPTAVAITGTAATPHAAVLLADGTTIDRAVLASPVPRAALRVSARGARLRLRVRTSPGALVIGVPPSGDGDDGSFLTEFPVIGAANASGRAKIRSTPITPGLRRLPIYALDVVHQIGDAWTCRLRWRGARLVTVRCSPDASATARATQLAARASDAVQVRRTPASIAARPRPSAAAARVTATAPARATTIGELERWELEEGVHDLTAGDVTGDGSPDVLYGDISAGEPRLWVSSAGGWHAADLGDDPLDGLAIVDDVTGDGIADVWSGTDRGYGGSAAWSATSRPAIDLTAAASLGPNDLALAAAGDDGADPLTVLAPTPLRDSTGDGRPELLVGGSAIYASEALPLGQRTPLPQAWPIEPASTWRRYAKLTKAADPGAAVADDDATDHDDELLAARPFTAPGQAPLNAVAVAERGANGATSSTVAIADLPTAPPWTIGASATLTLAGSARVVDGDAARGTVLVVTRGEACTASSCVARVRRIARDGRVLGSVAARVRRAADVDVDARFVADGGDADDQPDVAVRLGAAKPAPVRLWASSQESSAIAGLPALADRGTALQAYGDLVGWRADGAPRGLVLVTRSAERGVAAVQLIEPTG